MGRSPIVGLVLLTVSVITRAAPSITTAFESSGIVHDIISKAPSAVLNVRFPSGAMVSEGNELTPTQVKDVPLVSYDADDSEYYTLIMTDPDGPLPQSPTTREWRHWLVVNIPGNRVSEGDHRSPFISSGPPQGTGLHRYVFLVYRQPGKIEFDEPQLTNAAIDHRGGFSTAAFAKKYNLGDPIAGNFYMCQWDDYVPLLHKKLGF